MTGVKTEVALWRGPWTADPQKYGALVANTLMADPWAERSPLHEAALQGRLLVLRTLLAQGFGVNIVTLDRVSPLHEACLGGHVNCARLLLDSGADVAMATVDGATPLFNACVSGNVACVRLLLERGPSPVPTYPGASPVHEAAKRGHRECMELLLASGVDIDLEVPRLGTPLFTACLFRRTDCVERLLQLGADVHRGRAGDTALHAAAQVDSPAAAELLTDYGANSWARNSEGKRPVELAPANGSAARVLLLRQGPSTLAQLCRFRIRQDLGRMRLHKLSSLCLPLCLSDFLHYR
ncbi:ankyrin repeat and SOCS box protein 11-like [Brienomyrus brachyistius]|uniref:ankyrin repeat and SOCS box protein 11-like n=1 Tax=Brienomyrus brachyistius TaxID=42636 RepID=UPI0020B1D477|nr:ankyrin repeat and SOCS box protein 11-like [Brienomyrus brachyistius]